LQWLDYLVISAVMSVSVIIGLYYRFSGGRQRTAAVSLQKINFHATDQFVIKPIRFNTP